MNEREAIARLRQGDIGGLEVLVREYQVQAVRTAYLVVRDRMLAEDIVQTAFIRAYERIGQFDPERPFGPWFLRSVANDAAKAAERGKRTTSLDAADEAGEASLADLLADPGADPADLAEEAERAHAVWKCLGRLPAKQRAAIVLRYFAGLSDADIAQRIDSSPATIRWHLHAARKRLRDWLTPWRAGGTGLGSAAAPASGYPRPGAHREVDE